MRKLLLMTALSLGVLVGASAQEKNKMWVGGSFSLGNSKVDNEGSSAPSKTQSYSFSPEIGFSLSEKIDLGFNVGYTHGQNKSGYSYYSYYSFDGSLITGSEDRYFNRISIGTFVRFNAYQTGILTLFVDGVASYGHGKHKSSARDYNNPYYGYGGNENSTNYIMIDQKDSANQNEYEIGLKPGLKFTVSDNIALVSRIGFFGYRYSKERYTKTDTWDMNVDLSNISIGANIYFR